MSKLAQKLPVREQIQEAGILAFNPAHWEIINHDLLSGAQGQLRGGGSTLYLKVIQSSSTVLETTHTQAVKPFLKSHTRKLR